VWVVVFFRRLRAVFRNKPGAFQNPRGQAVHPLIRRRIGIFSVPHFIYFVILKKALDLFLNFAAKSFMYEQFAIIHLQWLHMNAALIASVRRYF